MGRVGAGTGAPSRLTRMGRRPMLLGALAAAWVALSLHASASALAATGAISGSVTSAETHAPLEGIEVCAISTAYLEAEANPEAPEPGSEQLGCAITAANGEYVVTGLEAGPFVVSFGDPPFGSLNFLTQFYDGKGPAEEATVVTVKAGATTPAVDARLQEGAELSGTITNSLTGAPVEGAVVCAVPSSESAPGELACTHAGAGGAYVVGGLEASSYRVFALGSGLGLSYFGGSAASEATPVVVLSREHRSGVNIALRPAPAGERASIGPTPASAGGSPTAGGATPSGGAPSLGGGTSTSGVALANSFVREHHQSSLLVRLTCRSATRCRGRISLTVIRVVRRAGRSRHETVTIGSARFTAKAGDAFTVKVALVGAARSLLGAARGRLAARLRIVQSTPEPTHTTVKRVLLLGRRPARGKA